MNTTATVVSIITVIGCLILATRSSALRSLGGRRMIALALIWIAIILTLVMAIQFSGWRVAS